MASYFEGGRGEETVGSVPLDPAKLNESVPVMEAEAAVVELTTGTLNESGIESVGPSESESREAIGTDGRDLNTRSMFKGMPASKICPKEFIRQAFRVA